jgi:hypothetical protein
MRVRPSGQASGFHPEQGVRFPIPAQCRRGRLVRHVLAKHVHAGSIPVSCSDARSAPRCELR